MKKILPPLLLFVILAACNIEQLAQPPSALFNTPTVIPANSSNPNLVDSTQPESCEPDAALLETLQAALPYSESMIAPLSYGGEHSLIVWFAVPSLNETPTAEIETAAVSLAVQAAKDLLTASPCLESYDSLSFNVTDGAYWLWFSGSIRVADISDLIVELELASGGGNSSNEDNQGGGIQPVAGSNCDWAEIQQNIQETLFSPENMVALSHTRDSGGSQISAFWRVSDMPEQSDIRQPLVGIISMFGCLENIPNGISATLTSPDGTLIATAYLPLDENGNALTDDFIFALME